LLFAVHLWNEEKPIIKRVMVSPTWEASVLKIARGTDGRRKIRKDA